jgi:YbgC/YbaW family acyl-CoA thioester hydrolase
MSVAGPHGTGRAHRPQSELVLRRRVQFYELDSAGIVHFSTYFRYMEEAEHALWRAAGLSIAPPGSEIGYPRVNVSCDYHRPLRFEDEFDIRIRIVAMAEKSIRYECVLSLGDTNIATGSVTIVCVRVRPGEPMKAVPIPPDVVARFAVAETADA